MMHSRNSGVPRLMVVGALALSAIITTPLAAQRADDNKNDWAPTYTGPLNGDLDVASAQVYFDGSRFVFTATFYGPVGFTPGAFYVWGINKGNGNSPFGPNGAPNVKFNSTVIMRPLTGVTVGATAVKDFFWYSGNTITGAVPAALLPVSSTFTQDQFTWNLWPRATGPAGAASISDFAPNDGNNLMTLGPIPDAVFVTPEPGSVAMLGLGLLGLMAGSRRRRA